MRNTNTKKRSAVLESGAFITNRRLRLTIQMGNTTRERVVDCMPVPRVIPRDYRGFTFRDVGGGEIEITPSLSFGENGKQLLETPHAWRLRIRGKIPPPVVERPAVDYITSARRERESQMIQSLDILRRLE